MTPAMITALATGIPAVLAAVTALIAQVRHARQPAVQAHPQVSRPLHPSPVQGRGAGPGGAGAS